MSYMLPHLHNGWQVDQAILSEEDRVLVIRFGHDWDPTCMKMDEVLYSIAEKVGLCALRAPNFFFSLSLKCNSYALHKVFYKLKGLKLYSVNALCACVSGGHKIHHVKLFITS